MWTVKLPDAQAGFRKGRGIRSDCQHLLDHRKKQESSRKTSTFASLTTPKPLTVWITAKCGKFWKRWEYQTTWPSSWESVFRSRSNSWTRHGITDWFQIGKGVRQGCILSLWLINLYSEYIMRNAGLDEAQAGIKIARKNIDNLRYADTPCLQQKAKKN